MGRYAENTTCLTFRFLRYVACAISDIDGHWKQFELELDTAVNLMNFMKHITAVLLEFFPSRVLRLLILGVLFFVALGRRRIRLLCEVLWYVGMEGIVFHNLSPGPVDSIDL